MNRKKIYLLFLSLVMAAGLLMGCSGSSKKDYANKTDDPDNPVITGQVTAIDGNNITLVLMPEWGRQDGSGKTEEENGSGENRRPGGWAEEENGSGESRRPDGRTEEENESGESRKPGGWPNDIAPDTSDDKIQDIIPGIQSGDRLPKTSDTTEAVEKTITLTEDTPINIEDGDSTKTGTADDITVGCLLSVTYKKDDSGNETISSVTVRNFSGNTGGNRWASRGGAQSNDTSDSNGN